MKKVIFSFLMFVFFGVSVYGQDINTRIASIQNQFEVLKIETPGFEETLNINITQTTLSNFLLAISKVHKLNINVSPELNTIPIVNNFSNVSVADVLIFLVKEYNLEIDFTGNILSISKYLKPIEPPKEKEIIVSYLPTSNIISLDLKNDDLDAAFRTIMNETGKNLLFTPEIEKNKLSIFIKDVPLEVGLEKLATSNNLIYAKTDDGFYTFESGFETTQNLANTSTTSRPVRKSRTNFYYKVLDTINKTVEVNLENTPIADVIYTLGEDLKLDIFTATSLENAGTATVEAKEISFDLLLDKIFESTNGTASNANPSDNRNAQAADATSNFTYKRDGNIYYFGTEDQLSLKTIELVTMMHRSIQSFENPSGNGQRRAGRNSFNQNGNFVNNINGFNQNQNTIQNQNNSLNNRGSNTTDNLVSIEDIIPDDIIDGLDIKIDKELNSFVVSGPGAKVERFKEFIKFIDKAVPVIIIEVMILEVNRSAITETGVSFGIGDQPVETRGEFFPNANVTLGARDVNKVIGNFDGFGALNIGKVVPNFYLDIKAMETAGTLKVKSTPKLATLNGHKAFLSSGETSYYVQTNQTFFGSQIPQVSEIRNFIPIDAELSLEVLPFVSGDGQITLDIQVLQSAFNGERIDEDAPPGITSREFSSIVRMQDQDVVILGGIESVRKDDSGSGVPFLARIPIIKYLFSQRRREATKRNLNVLIKPTILY